MPSSVPGSAPSRWRLPLVALLAMGAIGTGSRLVAAESDPQATITLPPTCELAQLTDLVSQTTHVPIQSTPGRISGTIRLTLPGPVSTRDLWALFHQLLANQGLTTVVVGLPAVYHVVPLGEAAQFSRVLSPAEVAQLPYPPGYQVVLRDVNHLTADGAVKLLSGVFTGAGSQVRTLGPDGKRILLAAATNRITEADAILALIDQPGVTPAIRLFKPERTAPATLQAAALAAWGAMGRLADHPRTAEVQVAPDGVQLLLVAAEADLDDLERMTRALDQTEPVATRSYRPQHFSVDEVATLIRQTMGTGSRIEIIRDRLTASLLIKATAAEHARITDLVATLDAAPPAARRQTRSIAVKHRKAEEVAKLVLALVDGGSTATPEARSAPPSPQPDPIIPPNPPPGGNLAGQPPGAGSTGAWGSGPYGQPGPSGQPGMANGMGGGAGLRTGTTGVPSVAVSADGSLMITADPVTNRLLVLGDPRMIDQVEHLLAEIDQRQAQVDIELTLLSLTDSQNRDLGIELAKAFQHGDTSGSVASLFGLSTANGTSTVDRTPASASGATAVVLKPGQYAAVVRALETVNQGRSLIRSHLVVNNHAQAMLNGVDQQPVSSINSSNQVASIAYAGTTDAGTQVTLEPSISAADYVTLTYAISQSSFLGQATVTSNGVVPPAKRNDNVSSTATVPDGHVIALGGLSNHTAGQSESRVPWLGSIPLLGWFFKTRSDSGSDSRFYVFIRVNILRGTSFADLRHLSQEVSAQADRPKEGEPTLEPIALQ